MTTALRDDRPPKPRIFSKPTFWVALLSIVSLFVGILGVLLTYLALEEAKPAVTFETISDTNVLDLRRSLQDLSIVFRGQNVEEQNLNLRVMTINVVNTGKVDILPGHYDTDDDWGIQFKGSELIEARLVDASSEYLQSKVVPQRLNTDTAKFPKVIFEKDASFAIEVLLLHPKDRTPTISSIGKIAGINSIDVKTRPLAREEVGFLAELFQGSAPTQIVRLIMYMVGLLVGSVTSILALFRINELFTSMKSRRRRTRVLKTRTIREMDQNEISRLLVSRYELRGMDGLKKLRELINEPEKIEWVTPPARWIIRDPHQFHDGVMASHVINTEHRSIGFHSTLEDLVKVGVLQKGEEDEPILDEALSVAVDNLLSELEN